MLWWYEPRDETRLFAPAVDCHTGGIPDLAASVRVEHWGVLGSSRLTAGAEVKYTDHVPSGLAPYLPKRVIGRWFGGPMPNGDFVARVEDVRRGELHVGREIPPAA